MMVTNSGTGELFLPAVYLLVFYAVFSDTDYISIDAFRRRRYEKIDDLDERLQSRISGEHSMSILKWLLVTLGIIYFLNGAAKIQVSGFRWLNPDSLQRYLLNSRSGGSGVVFEPLNQLFVQYDLIAFIGTVSNFVLEIGFLIAIVAGITITPFVIGLVGFHTLIALTMSPFFFDNYILLLLLLPWDNLHSGTARDNQLDIVYDNRCHFCIRSLLIIKSFDTAEIYQFIRNSDVPPERERDDLDYNSAMYVFDNDDVFRGYYGFQRILRTYWISSPLATLMGLPLIRNIGVFAYERIAANRSRIFVCSVEEKGPKSEDST